MWPAVLLGAWSSFAAGDPTSLPEPLRGTPAEVEARVRAFGSGYETAWNRWLAQLLRLRTSSDPTHREWADSLDQSLRFVARFESESLGTRHAADALTLVDRWSDGERRLRVRAFEAESIAAATAQTSGIADAKPYYVEAIDLHRRLGERRRLAVFLGSYVNALFGAGEVAEADSIARLALAARRAIGDRRLEGNTLNDLGLTSRGLQQLREAKVWLVEAARLRETTGQPAHLGTTLGFLALTMSEMGSRDSVEALYRRALALTVADSARMLRVLVNFGGWLNDHGSSAEAIALNERASDHARQMEDRKTEGEALLNLGGALGGRARYSEAARAIERSVRLGREMDNTDLVIRSLIQLGLTWVRVPDLRRARGALFRAQALADSTGAVVLQVKALNNLALADLEQGLPKGARRLAEEALRRAMLARDSTTVREVANTMAVLSLEARDTSACVAWFRRAADATRAVSDDGRAADLINLGWAELFAGQRDSAVARFEEAIPLARGVGADDLAWPAHCGVGEAAERRGDYATALSGLRRAASIIDTLRRHQASDAQAVKFLGGRMSPFEGLVHLLTKLAPGVPDSAYAEEAFRWAERARARQLRDLLEVNGVVGTRSEPPSIAEVQAWLANDEALLYYSMGDSSSSLWLIRSDRSSHHRLPRRDRIQAQVNALRSRLSDPIGEAGRIERGAADLFSLLVRPVEADLRGVRRLRIAPDGGLWRLPFEALVSAPARPEPGGARARYLIDRWTVSYVPSAALLTYPAPGTADSTVFVIANPAYDRPRTPAARPATTPPLMRLPGTVRELEVLRALAGPAAVRALSGPQATRTRALASPGLRTAGIVHIGAHGDVDIEPELSGLWLAPEKSGEPTKLTVEDILGLRPRANLATLSACRTGLGELERGEGVIGLTRAFLAGGTRSVLVSLWDASDRWTPALMERFYRAYLSEGIAADEALARAKRDLIARTPARAPFYWALFVLVGAPDARPRAQMD